MIIISRSLFIGIFIVWHLASLIYIDSLGSLRQSLPQNIISWLSISLTISIIAFTVFYRKIKIIITLPAICYCFSLAILMMGLISHQGENNNVDFWYCSGITVGVLLYIAGLQVKKKWLIQSFCIYCYIIINVAQVFITAYQYIFEADIFYLASGVRSNGLSQQVNILSVNMATACLLSLMTLVLSQFSLLSKRHEKIRIVLLGTCVLFFTLTLVVLQSVIAWLSFTVCAFIFICLFYKKNPLRVSASYFIIAVAIFIGVYLIKLCPQYIGTDVMNQFHLKQMLRFSITLFLEKPYDAWEQSFLFENSYERTAIPFFSPKMYIVPHPHNEILLWLMTGGLINLIFLSLLLTGGIYVVFQSFIKYKINGNGYPLAIILSIIPIIIHNHVEYPFLLSVLHWGIVILFLSFSDAAFALEEQSLFYINKQLSYLFSFIVFIIGLGVFIIGLFLFNGEKSFYTQGNYRNENIAIRLSDSITFEKTTYQYKNT
ncbi:O-antigen ligase domain-containing protein [Providencia rettgeri]|uniref:O-antigen ligase family protein n=1 Tax=Providencia TaxID=586 RepID=UPI001FF8313A|nr:MULTISPECIES: O-antigen ligase domain-containing protein [Providencia]WOB87086.1 O-antigen ligase domain-containing protein [Providencia sp. PROV040]